MKVKSGFRHHGVIGGRRGPEGAFALGRWAAAFVATLGFVAPVLAQPASAQPASTGPAAAQPASTGPAGNEALVTPALAPPRAQAAPAAASSQPAEDAAAAREAALMRKLLAGPPDASALSELADLRNRQLRRDADALDALARGLRLYLEIGPRLAAGPLDKATANPNVFSLAVALPRPLDEIAGECRATASTRPWGSAAGGEAVYLCPKCGDTRLAPCTAGRCNGSGYVTCPKCGAAGVLRGPDSEGTVRVLGMCDQCGGAGVVACQACGGTGSVQCAACKPKPTQAAASLLPEKEVTAIQKVIFKAQWIRAGGIDLYTNGARDPSPK
jgi:predicted RNA-binding Zn-ribbon protein involved in translation (DUF1610 family)